MSGSMSLGVNRFNQAGGAIMDDFDDDGLLGLAVTTWDLTQPMACYRNKSDGTFEDRSEEPGVTGQFGGLVFYQADYDNDGWPTSGTTQVLHDIAADQAIEVTEFAQAYRPLNVKPIRAHGPWPSRDISERIHALLKTEYHAKLRWPDWRERQGDISMRTRRRQATFIKLVVVLAGLVVVVVLGVRKFFLSRSDLPQIIDESHGPTTVSTSLPGLRAHYAPRLPIGDLSGFLMLMSMVPSWKPESSLEELKNHWHGAAYRAIDEVDRSLADRAITDGKRVALTITKACLLNSEGETEKSYQLMHELRAWVERKQGIAANSLATVIYIQGVTAMRRGENDNCIMCRGESSCIFPISAAAVHSNPRPAPGSRSSISPSTSSSSRQISRSAGCSTWLT